jgi:B12-binding domain/radical SAM domain protein
MNMQYDAILIHPPAIYDFRSKILSYGPVGYTVRESTDQFIIPAVGILSIADYLDRNGYKVVVDNLGERMVYNLIFDAEEHIKRISAKVYAIGLHWCVHSQGAIEVAKLCKKLHPDAMVVMGGLTSTVFSSEIIEKYEFIDAVIRGEAEKSFLALMRALENGNSLDEVPNLTFRDNNGNVRINQLMEPCSNLDEFEFTRLDLLEPKQAVYPESTPPHWSIPICRGCIHNCISCGGAAYSYRKYMGRKKPAFRSPEKIVEDIQKLNAQGIYIVFLFQDPRMGGSEYCNRLITTLSNSDVQLNGLTMELFGPANEGYIKKLAGTGIPINLTMSPESGSDSVRISHGRSYTTGDIFKTVEYCKKYGITLGLSTMIALAKDTPRTVAETWQMWEQICIKNLKIPGDKLVSYAFGPMLLLDPGSIGFDNSPDKGYSTIFKNLEDYIRGMSLPVWNQWISYETKLLDRKAITKLIVDSLERSINLRKQYGFYSAEQAEAALTYYVKADREIIDAVNKVLNI